VYRTHRRGLWLRRTNVSISNSFFIPPWKDVVARRNGLTPFSLYQGRWNAAHRDMESEINPMCEDQGMAIVSWASLGGGQLVAAEQRKKLEKDPHAGKGFYSASEDDIKVCNVLERLAKAKNATLQDIVSVAAQETSPSKLITCQ
jgi:aryl-alcohol dehydrogenase-like predicted oxidoreductase